MQKRAAELHFAESEAIAKPVRGAGELFQSCAALRFEQIQLLVAVRKSAEAYAKQPDFSGRIAVHAKEFLKHSEDICVETCGLAERLGSRMRFETCVAKGRCEGSCGKAGFAEALAGLLRKMAEHRGQRDGILGVFAKGVVVRDGLRLRIDHEFVGIAASRFAIQRRSPLPENRFQLLLPHGR